MKKLLTVAVCLFFSGCVSVPPELPVVAPAASGHKESAEVSRRKDPVLKADHVLTVLGEPTVIRREKPSQVWVYSQAECVLFIYMDEQSENAVQVKHMEIGTPSFGAADKNAVACLRTAAKLR